MKMLFLFLWSMKNFHTKFTFYFVFLSNHSLLIHKFCILKIAFNLAFEFCISKIPNRFGNYILLLWKSGLLDFDNLFLKFHWAVKKAFKKLSFFVWEILRNRDVVLLLMLFKFSLIWFFCDILKDFYLLSVVFVFRKSCQFLKQPFFGFLGPISKYHDLFNEI